LVSALIDGGAYQIHAASPMDAKAKGEATANELIGASGSEVRVYTCQLPQCDSFWDVLWDWTWVMIDLVARRIHLLCATMVYSNGYYDQSDKSDKLETGGVRDARQTRRLDADSPRLSGGRR
jgi:hypothetical protein